MDKSWLRAFAWRTKLRQYDEIFLPGFEAVVISADEKIVKVATHDLFKTELHEVESDEFFRTYVFEPMMPAETNAAFLRNTMRTIANKVSPGVALALERYLDAPPTMEEVPVTKPKKGAAPSGARVCADYHRHSCIELSRDDSAVDYILLSAEGGLSVERAGVESFDETYKPTDTYPIDRAARLYVEFAQHLGATEEAMHALAKFTTVSEKELKMATAKAPGAADGAKKPTPAVKNAPAAKKTTEKKPVEAAKASAPATKTSKPATAAKTAAVKIEKAPKEKKATAAARFQDLIMEGKLDDDAIFATVKKEFGLDDDKRGYVTWYRNYLTKKGKNPPAAKEVKKAA
jgi:hypothetical protein